MIVNLCDAIYCCLGASVYLASHSISDKTLASGQWVIKPKLTSSENCSTVLRHSNKAKHCTYALLLF